ncbi:hypothetical protein EXU57_12180 [Segetibacter sp. 3557_3]|uniref:hypothetical protein n=1 Tax=Segetibacter sp. 3557_3 TaxID=2547429 RepID=UPI00105851E9|nr:hypothetical protein [Segetibacter sp. 3557_3]TDH26239.1 hypothetical protein EXU57_12180 [Segetibacter sp. 3557_3]
MWQIRFCRVIGKVKKDFNIDGQLVVKPLCKARVHICEVDKVLFWLDKIPDNIILRIPDLILEPVRVRPFPIPPDPGPFFRPGLNPILPDTHVLARKLKSPANVRVGNPTSLNKAMPAIDPQIKQQLQTRNSSVIKTTIAKNIQLFHPFFCNYPWIWPWLYRCDEIKTVYTDNNGRFDTPIIYWANGDKPDIYFWVEYLIDGTWATIYKPPIPCFTYWDYACGSEITIKVTDPRVRAGCNETITGEQVWVRSIGNVSLRNIRQDDADLSPIQGMPWHRIGLSKQPVHDLSITDNVSPFATGLHFIIKFGSGLPNNGARYFRWKAIKIANPDLTPFFGGTTRYLNDAIAKPYYVEYLDVFGNPQTTTKFHTLGPVPGTSGLFLIPPATPLGFLGETDDSAVWQTADTISAAFDSNGLFGDGLYQFTLELFDQHQNKIFREPTIYKVSQINNSGATENATPEFITWDMINGTNDFKMVVRVDNTPAEGAIHDVQVGSNFSGACGFIKYTNANAQQVKLSFQAHHDNHFAAFNFVTIKGNNFESCPGDTGGFVFSATPGYSRTGQGEFVSTPLLTPAALMGTCTKSAFSEGLYVTALHNNGYHRIAAFDVSDTNAFALEP